jgi:hypothetical protein
MRGWLHADASALSKCAKGCRKNQTISIVSYVSGHDSSVASLAAACRIQAGSSTTEPGLPITPFRGKQDDTRPWPAPATMPQLLVTLSHAAVLVRNVIGLFRGAVDTHPSWQERTSRTSDAMCLS